MKYQNLNNYVNYLRSFPRHSPREYLELSRIKKLLALMGHPEKKLKGIQVAGTNGKGTTVALAASVLKEAGYKVGAFYSPHLVSYTERFRINGRPISQKKFADIINRLKPLVKKTEQAIDDQPTWFEVLTAASVLYFTREKVDWVVYEVGLGGRLDATTALGLKYKIITDIGYDHTQILGKTIKEIAKEKAAIIGKRDIVATSNNGPAYRIISRQCRRYQAELLPTVKFKMKEISLSGTKFDINDAAERIPAVINFVGAKQAENAGLVYSLIKKILVVDRQTIIKGLKRARLEGRFQIVSRRPLTVADGAHNPQAVGELLKTLAWLGLRKKTVFIYAVKNRKKYRPIIKLLARFGQVVIFPDADIPNMASPQKLKKILPAGLTADSLKKAVQIAKTKVKKNGMIMMTGSFYFVGEALRIFRSKKRQRLDQLDDNQIEIK